MKYGKLWENCTSAVKWKMVKNHEGFWDRKNCAEKCEMFY